MVSCDEWRSAVEQSVVWPQNTQKPLRGIDSINANANREPKPTTEIHPSSISGDQCLGSCRTRTCKSSRQARKQCLLKWSRFRRSAGCICIALCVLQTQRARSPRNGSKRTPKEQNELKLLKSQRGHRQKTRGTSR